MNPGQRLPVPRRDDLDGSRPARDLVTASGEPYLPAAQTVYWVDTAILPAPDPEPQRAVVVLAAPATTYGTVAVASRSSTDGFGVDHPADARLGLSSPGWFSRRLPVPAQLWTPATTAVVGRLDDTSFAAVRQRFGT